MNVAFYGACRVATAAAATAKQVSVYAPCMPNDCASVPSCVCLYVCASVCVGKLKKSRKNTLQVFSGRLTAKLPYPAPCSALILSCSRLPLTAYYTACSPFLLPSLLTFFLFPFSCAFFPYLHLSTLPLTFTPFLPPFLLLPTLLLHLLQSPRTYVLSSIVPRRRARLYLFILTYVPSISYTFDSHSPLPTRYH